MCAVLRELLVPLSDLRHVVITCTKCKTDITFDLLLEWNGPPMSKTTATPQQCPACEAHFDQQAQESLDAMRKAYQCIMKQKSIVFSFRVRMEAVSLDPAEPSRP